MALLHHCLSPTPLLHHCLSSLLLVSATLLFVLCVNHLLLETTLQLMTDTSENRNLIILMSDNVGIQITSIKLNDSNYVLWAKAVQVYLTAREKEQYILDDPPAAGKPEYKNWKTNNSKVMTWLWNSMEPQISTTVMFFNTAKEIWNALESRFSNKKNISRIYDLYAGILHCIQNDRSVSAYYGQLEGMWEEINVYHPLTNDTETMRKQ